MSDDGFIFNDWSDEGELCELCGKRSRKFYESDRATTLCATCYDANPDPCVWCGHSTAFGYGRFVNRLSVDDGWGCAECSGYECDTCSEQIYLDTDITDTEEKGHYHTYCLPIDKWHADTLEWFNDLSLQEQEMLLTKPIKE